MIMRSLCVTLFALSASVAVVGCGDGPNRMDGGDDMDATPMDTGVDAGIDTGMNPDTGTDTGVGKTVVSVALVRALVARGLKVAAMKPVAAGAIDTPDGPRNDDALELLAASNVSAHYDDVNPCLLATPASPHLAARHAGISIRVEPILRSRARLAAEADLLIVEGAGGWLAPISALETMGDLARRRAEPLQHFSVHAYRSRLGRHVRHDDPSKRRGARGFSRRDGFVGGGERVSGIGPGTGDSR